MAAIRQKRFTAQPAGAAGSAVYTEQWTPGRPGIVRFVYVNYGSGVPATTDVVINRDNSSGTAVLTRTSSTTDVGPIAVGTAGMDEAAAASAATDGLSGGIPFTSGLYLDVAQADPYADSTDEVVIDVFWEPVRKKDIVITATGAAGSAAGNTTWTYGRPGVVRFLAVDYHADNAATADLTIKRDSASGATLFTRTDSETDIAPTAVGTTAGDEAFAATAATDAVAGGLLFNTGLYCAIAQTDASTTTVSVWYDA